MKTYSLIPLLFCCAIMLSACKSDGPPTSGKAASEVIVGKNWSVLDAGLLESSFREQKGEPYKHTIQWLSTSQDLSAESRELLNKFLSVTLVLDENKNPNDDSGNVAHLEGLGLEKKQGYFFTSSQEENAYDRTIKLQVVNIFPDGNIVKYPFTILHISTNKILLAAPPEIEPRNLVLSLETK